MSMLKLSYPLLRRITAMKSREIISWQDQTAEKRHAIIAPLLDDTLDRAKKTELRRRIAEEQNISEKTIRRYEAAYQRCGFSGLRPVERGGTYSRNLPDHFGELLAEAIQLKREVPTRSVAQLIFILEGENRVPPNQLKRSTLQRYLFQAGFGLKQMKKYSERQKSSSRRYCKPHRMMLVQADIKYGPGLLIMKSGRRSTAYLSSVIDDHSRLLLASEWYDSQEEYVVEDVFRKAILNYGKFDRAYTDHGKQYVSRQLNFSLARLGIRMSTAPIRSGASKGKIEKFHQMADDFIAEIRVKKVTDLAGINEYWKIFLDEYYHKKPHEGIREYYESQGVTVPGEGISPIMEWNRDTRPLIYLDTGVIAEAFLYHERRVVDKGGCISFRGMKYEVSGALIGAEVEISYDPASCGSVTVRYRNMDPMEAHPVKIGEYCSRKPEIPAVMQESEPVTSRFLDVLVRKHQESQKKLADAISYGDYGKEEK
jgi:transposase